MLEQEVRLGRRIDGKYVPGVTRDVWYQLLKQYSENTSFSSSFSKDTMTKYANDVRVHTPITAGTIVVETKQQLSKKEEMFELHGVSYVLRLTQSEETPLSKTPSSPPLLSYQRTRRTFTHLTEDYHVDFTYGGPNPSYQVEIEYTKDPTRAIALLKSYLGTDIVDADVNTQIRALKSGYVVNPTNLKEDLIPLMRSYALTNKLNGVRKLLAFYNGKIYECSANMMQIRPLNIAYQPSSIENVLLESEFYQELYHIYDIVGSQDILPVRLQKIKDIVSILSYPTFLAKKFYFEDIPEKVEQLLNILDKRENDGLIFSSTDTPYETTKSYKWKWPEELTIDFQVRYNYELRNMALYYMVEKNELKLFTSKNPKFTGVIPFDARARNNAISEFQWNGSTFVYVRDRSDKTFPNFRATVESVWYDIQHPIFQEKLLVGLRSELKVKNPVRGFHNYIKSQLIQKIPSQSRVLDIGFGNGGDMNKYTKANIQTVYAVEPYLPHIQKFQSRVLPPNLDISLYHGSGTDTAQILSHIKTPVSHGVSMFSLTFFFESQEMLTQLVNTIDTCVAQTFLGITLDGASVERALRQRSSIQYGSDITITKEYQDTDPFKQITFSFQDSESVYEQQKEYLVDFALFTSMMQERGFVLEETEMLSPPYKGEEADFSMMNRWFVFQRKDIQTNVIVKPVSDTPFLSSLLAHRGIDITKPHEEAIQAYLDSIVVNRATISKISEKDSRFVSLLRQRMLEDDPSRFVPDFSRLSVSSIITKYGQEKVMDTVLEEYTRVFKEDLVANAKTLSRSMMQFHANNCNVNLLVGDTPIVYVTGRKYVKMTMEYDLLCNIVKNKTDFSESLW